MLSHSDVQTRNGVSVPSYQENPYSVLSVKRCFKPRNLRLAGRDRCTVPEARLKPRDRGIGDRSGSEKAAGQDRQEEKASQMSKRDEVDQFA